MKSSALKWIGTIPENCDICGDRLTGDWIDGRSTKGSWAYMCPVCFDRYGVGLGLGRCQKYNNEGLRIG